MSSPTNSFISTLNKFSLSSERVIELIVFPSGLGFLEELFNSIDVNTSKGQRDLLILEMLYATGVRVGELVNIKVKDIDRSTKQILILGKGNKERFVTYGEYCEDILNAESDEDMEWIDLDYYLFGLIACEYAYEFPDTTNGALFFDSNGYLDYEFIYNDEAHNFYKLKN